MVQKIDYAGWENEYLKYINDVEPYIKPNGKKERRARFLCKRCGDEFITRINHAVRGATKSCGCLRSELSSVRQRDKTWKQIYKQQDQKFGMLTIVSEAEDYIRPNGDHLMQVLCRCDCGNEIVVRASELLGGQISCGCYTKQITSKIKRNQTWKRIREQPKQKFGMLTVIGQAEDYIKANGEHETRVRCRCECGNEKVVLAGSLFNGDTTSCGCRKNSKAEENIDRYLYDINVSYGKQIRINDCVNPTTNHTLPFDFALFDNNKQIKCLIEYQGEQHYKDTGDFGRVQREVTDKIKKDYCISNNIQLYEIRYDQNEVEELKKILQREVN